MLTEDQKRLLITLIEKGQPLPAEYRRQLFATDDSEYVERTGVYTLEYKGKAREQDILADTPAAPLQEIRSFNADNPHAQADWRNLLIYGDNLLALKALYEDQRGANHYGTRDKIKLIYIDPPFATKQDFMKDREKAYRDKLVGAQFIEFLRKRLVLLRELLANDGSIFVHLDWKKGHYIKAIMDEVFGENNFINEIVWQRSSSHNDAARFGIIHDSIFLYGKGDSRFFKQIHTEYSQAYIDERFRNIEEGTDRRYWLNTMTAAGQGPARFFNGKVLEPPPGTHWRFGQKRIDQSIKDGKISFSASGMPYVKQYLDESLGRAAQSIWTDVVPSKSGSELTGYPTQKPEDLLDRIIRSATKQGDIVLDAFIGSGTSISVAEKLHRRWVGIDCGRLAIYTAQKRLLNLTTQIGAEKKDERREHERVENFSAHSKSGSKAALLLFDKAADGELEITDAMLTDFAAFLKENCLLKKGKTPEFSLLCPEEKLSLQKLKIVEDEEIKAGQYAVDVGGVRFLISFIDPKTKSEPPKPLKAKHFALLNAGVYDRAKIRQLDWASYKPFVMQLFGVREGAHPIHHFRADGHIGTDSVHIWNFPDQKNLTLDEGYVQSLHDLMRGLGGDRFYIVAPVSALDFMTDELRIGGTRYIVLKVPESVLNRLLAAKSPGALKQPMSENDVNAVIDAVGFDFVSQPLTEQQFLTLAPENADLTNQHLREAVVRLTMFRAKTLTTSPEDFPNFATLSMVMVDPAFNGDVFTLGKVHWAEDLVASELKRLDSKVSGDHATKAAACQHLDIRIPLESLGENAMVILVDQYGNEKRLEIHRDEFSPGKTRQAQSSLRRAKVTTKKAIARKVAPKKTPIKKAALKKATPKKGAPTKKVKTKAASRKPAATPHQRGKGK